MIIVINAAGSTGKTLMAQQLLEKYQIPYYSLDHLKMGIYRGNPACGFSPEDETEVIAEKLWPLVKGMMMTAIENDQHLIIEGSYILPHHLKEFDESYAEEIIPVFMGFSTSYIQQHFESKIKHYRNVIENRLYPEDRTIERVIEEHQALKEQCQGSDIAYFEIKQDYEEEILKVYGYIDREKRKIDAQMEGVVKMTYHIRQEEQSDYEITEKVVEAAFASAELSDQTEHHLVSRLRKSDAFIPELSLVAIDEKQVIGHILLTKIAIVQEDGPRVPSLALAPVSVLPEEQEKGVGKALIEKALEEAKALGYQSVIVLGHPAYYPKFGFKKASQWQIKAPFEVPEEAFMALELEEGALDGLSGVVEYSSAFFG